MRGYVFTDEFIKRCHYLAGLPRKLWPSNVLGQAVLNDRPNFATSALLPTRFSSLTLFPSKPVYEYLIVRSKYRKTLSDFHFRFHVRKDKALSQSLPITTTRNRTFIETAPNAG